MANITQFNGTEGEKILTSLIDRFKVVYASKEKAGTWYQALQEENDPGSIYSGNLCQILMSTIRESLGLVQAAYGSCLLSGNELA